MRTAIAGGRGPTGSPIVAALRRAIADWRPPLQRSEFWIVQGLVLLIAMGHVAMEIGGFHREHSAVGLLPPALYLVPVVYAAVEFGLRGSLLTALWASLLVLPNILLWHSGLEVVVEVFQVGWVVMVAIFVGFRVDGERRARLDAQEREEARRASEERHRAIFDAVAEPVVVLDAARNVEAANAAAGELFRVGAERLTGRPLPGSLGAAVGDFLERPDVGADRPVIIRSDDPPAWIQPLVTPFQAADGTGRLQLLLVDVTASQERERGLEGVARQTLLAREEEGRRISRELHDGPVQSLVALWRRLDLVADSVDGAAAQQIVEARGMAESIAAELRRVSRDLRPSVLDDLGVVAAVRSEAEAFASRSGLATHVEIDGEPRRLDPILELALLRITQEALRNVKRHAGARQARIGLAFTDGWVRLAVSDDGHGLDPVPSATELLQADHLGLIGMRERARAAGAELSLGTSVLGGLLVEVTAPV